MKPYSERRKHPRLKSYDILNVVRMSEGSEIGEPALSNISLGGICFYCHDLLIPGDRIRVNIAIKDFNCVVLTHARVIWSQPSTEIAANYMTGAEFVGMNETDREILRRLERSRPHIA